MWRTAATTLALCAVLASGASSQDATQRLVTAANLMVEAASNPQARPGQLVGALREGCLALEQVVDDRVIRQDLIGWMQLDSAATRHGERVALANDLSLFITAFLGAERAILEQLGYGPATVDFIASAAVDQRDALREPNLPDVLEELQALRDDSCTAYLEFLNADRDPSLFRRFGQFALGIGGVALVAADVVGLPATAGYSAGSILIGGAIIAGTREGR